MCTPRATSSLLSKTVSYTHLDVYKRQAVSRSLDAMREKGYLYEKDGALWFRSTDLGDDKDRVLIKGDGEATYFMSDVAYHYDKMMRGFDHLIDLWGADNHGYIKRCECMLEAWGWPGAVSYTHLAVYKRQGLGGEYNGRASAG